MEGADGHHRGFCNEKQVLSGGRAAAQRGGGAGDTTAAAVTTCVADQITASSFRLRTNGSSRCWANGSQIRWIALAI